MSSCCEDKSCEVTALKERHANVLWFVLAINAVMFLVEIVAGIQARSTSLLADGLDMFGDALVYGFSLVVLNRSLRWQARAALAKGAFMLAFGLAVAAEVVHKVVVPVAPHSGTMGVIGGVALAANLLCFVALYRYRGDGLNMSSTWLCSRNDLLANVGVLIAAAATSFFAAAWPDTLVGAVISTLFVTSSVQVLRGAVEAMASEIEPKDAAITGRSRLVVKVQLQGDGFKGPGTER